MNEWETALAAGGGLLTALGAAVAAWNAWGKQRSDSSRLTLDGVFQLVNELQEEHALCRARIRELEDAQREDRQTMRNMQTELETLRMGRMT